MEKNKVKINKVSVAGPPFMGRSFDPTNVNFLFGKNGSGKSTISRAIRDKNGISWVYDPGHGTSIQVFNEEYIKDNIEGEMDGVFTISEPDIETEKAIKEKTKEQEDNGKDINRQREVLSKCTIESTDLRDRTYQACWSITRGILKQLSHNPTHAGSKDKFYQQISVVKPVEHTVEELQKLEKIAYDADLKHIGPLRKIRFPELNTSILNTAIVALEETQFSIFMKEMGPEVTDWVFKGLKRFQPLAKGKCPYCQETLTQEKKIAIEQAFDDSYTRAVEALKKLKENDFPRFRSYVQQIVSQFQGAEGFEFVDQNEFKLVVQEIEAYLSMVENMILLKESALSRKMDYSDIAPIEKKINELIDEANKKIEKHNELVASGDKKGAFADAVKEHLAYLCQETIDDYKVQMAKLEKVKADATKRLKDAEEKSDDIIEKLAKLREKTTSTLPVINKINNLLEASGFNSFSIAPEGKRNYKLVRPDNTDATFLSEGEKNFICFLYFYYSVCGVMDKDVGLDDRVVVIDDPVSSMDSDSVFIIAELVREIVDAALNAFNPVRVEDVPTHIKQVFVLTHNSFFYNEVAPMYLDNWENVSYFEIQKEGTLSKVERNTKKINPGALNEREVNYIPDLGNYSSLWEIYNTSDNPRILMNTMRRILEEYFLHNLGYAPRSFKGQILSALKGDFGDPTDKILARALVNYVANDEISSINFSTYTSDITKLKAVFKKVFETAEQSQHYDMMVNR